MESRSDSLAAELKRQGIFDDYFSWWLQERPSFADRMEWLEKHNCATSMGSLHRLHKSPEAAQWRNAEAARAVAAMNEYLPSDMDATIRKALLDQRFNGVLGELSHKQLMDHVYADVAVRRLELDEQIEPQKIRLAERKVVMQEARTKAADAVNEAGKRLEVTPDVLKEILAAVDRKLTGEE